MSQRYSGGLITTNTNINNSIFFNGSSTWLTFAGASQYAIANSTTPFTVECWIKPIGSGGVILSEGFTGTGNTLSLVCSLATSNTVENTAGNFPAFGWFNGSAWVTAAASTTAIVLNVWSHVAFVFTGSTSRIYINGIDVTKPSLPTPATTWGVTGVNGDGWYIGRAWTGGGNTPNANISNLRFVNGTAVYTANFAPPYTLAPITNTALLTCQPYNFVGNLFDNSSYNATITIVGPITAVRDNPFGIFSPPYNPALGAATPGVWELNEAAAAAAQRSWNMYDPFFNLNTAMVHGNGTNGGTNNTFLDSSTNNFAITRNGNTTQGSFSPFSEPNGYWSNYFDGTGDYLAVASNAAFGFGTGDFTIEFWARPTILSPRQFFYDAITTDPSVTIQISTDTNGLLAYYVNGAIRIQQAGAAMTTNVWHHVAVSRVSANTRMFLNGVQVGATYADTNSYITAPLKVMHNYNLSVGSIGSMSNLRVVKGTGVYSANFTPPTSPLTNITNTVLLTCQSNRIVDNSSSPLTITKNGDVRALGFSAFYNPTAYLPQKNGGSILVDGSGDDLTFPSNTNTNLGSSDFTVESFFYTPGSSVNNCWFINGNSSSFAALRIQFESTGTTIFMSTTGSTWAINSTVTGAIPPADQWFHLAVVRDSTSIRMYLNGAQVFSSTAISSGTSLMVGTDNRIGAIPAGFPLNGFISNFRIVKGTALYTSAFTPPTSPLTAITNTQLLLSGTNAAIFDNAANLTFETFNTSISTAQSKYGSGSMLFNGTSSYVNIITPFRTGSSFGVNVIQTLGDFTVEGWVNPITVNAQRTMFYINGNNNSYAAVRLDHTSTGAVQILVSFNGAGWTINTTTSSLLVNGTWTHLAVVRIGTNITVYYNGVAITTNQSISAATALMTGTNSVLGALFSTTYGGYFNGYISDFRTTNYARYQGNFTPPTSTLQNQ